MPIDHLRTEKEFSIGIWKLNESLAELHKLHSLSADELSTLESFKSDYRKREWLTTRILVKNILKQENIFIGYDSTGKPRIVNSKHAISISHTKNFVAVILSASFQVGIDLETIQPRISALSKRFVNVNEEQFIASDNAVEYFHVIWGAKEVLFKLYSKGELNFLENLQVEPFVLKNKGELMGKIIKDDYQKNYNVFYEKRGEIMLVFSMDDEQSE